VLFRLGTGGRRRRQRLGRNLQIAAFVWLWLASTPCVGGRLLHSLQGDRARPADGPLPDADANVVLSAGADLDGAEYGGPVIDSMTLQRLRYAAALHRRTGLPILTSGGRPARGVPPLATMMQAAAERELGVTVRWTETRSADTRENARFSAEQLREHGVHTVLLVTSAWHMPRAAASFRRHGVDVVPAPTAFRGAAFASWSSFVPHWTGLRDTGLALHEWGGRVFYALTN
jgi:uncharacterized SAM-binding protein YcdF (DUF218 family)